MTTQTLDDIRPASTSESGKNSHILTCGIMGERRYYAACLKLINEKNPSRSLRSIYSDCFEAINNRTCPAMKMQKEEASAGLALYFQERKTEFSTVPVPTLKVGKRSQKPVEKPQVKKENNGLGFSAPSYADVLNSVIEKEQQEKKPEVKPAPVEKVAMKPNESLLDLAKRMLAQKSN